MKKLLSLLCCLVLLAGCGPVAVSPPVTPPPIPQPQTTLVKATLTAGDKKFDLSLDEEEKNLVYDLNGTLTFEFSSSVELDSLAENELFEYGSANYTVLTAPWSRWDHVIDVLTELKDTNGEPVVWGGSRITLTRVPFPRPRVSLVGHPDISINGWLAVGETVCIEFAEDVNQDFILEQIKSGIIAEYRENNEQDLQQAVPNTTLEWVSDRALHLTIHDSVGKIVKLRPNGLDFRALYFHIVPRQRVVVATENGEPLVHLDLPLSGYRAIGMTSDYTEVRFVRNVIQDTWPMGGLEQYTLNRADGKFVPSGTPLFAYACQERYGLYEWMQESRREYSRYDIAYRACGLSNSGEVLAVFYYEGEVRLHDLSTGQSKSYVVPVRLRDDSDEPSPHWMYWGVEDTRIFYNAPLDNGIDLGLHTLDLHTGEVSTLTIGYYLLYASPYSEHLFATKRLGDYYKYSFNIVDYSGSVTQLGETSEHVALAKWIDAERVLLNKGPDGATTWQCYIYYLNENRWQYIAEGYGFDYDLATGQVYLLQPK